MPISTVTPQTGLNLDSDYSNIRNGDFVDANDVKIKSDGTSNGYVLQNFDGNEYKFTIPDLTPQNKKWILLGGADDPLNAYTLTLYDAYNNILATATNVTFGGLLTAFDTALGIAGISFVRVNGTYSGKTNVTYEFTSIPFYNYKLINTGNQFEYIYLVSEAFDDAETNPDYTAMKRILNTSQVDGGVYIFSTNIGIQSTTRGSIIAAANVVSSGGVSPVVRINTAVLPYGVVNGDHYRILITDSSQSTYNGIHIAEVINNTDILLVDVPWVGAIVGTLEQTHYISTYGEIGYLDNRVFQYTKLFGTAQWDFTVLKPVDSRAEPQAEGHDNIYFTSLQERFRIFSLLREPNTSPYKYDFATFGLNLVTPYHFLRYGLYDYETVATETLLQLPNISKVTFTSQSATGGAIKAGNWRYMVSFLSQEGAAETELSDLTNIINVYLNNTNDDYSYVIGNTSDTITSKINNFEITDYPLGVYKYVVLYGIHYAEGATIVYRIKQQLIDNVVDVINISHYGTEIYELVSFNELRFSNIFYKGQNIEIIDNRLTFSNLIKQNVQDLTEFTDTITYNIQKETLSDVGEYKNPLNTNQKLGCMVNEGYVYAFQYELFDGTITDQVYPMNEVIVINGDNTPVGKRVAGGITDTSIQDSVTGFPFVFYPRFIIDWDNVLIDGKPCRDVIKRVKVWRAEVINPRVVACGFVIPAVKDNAPVAPPTFLLEPSGGTGGFPFANDYFAFPDFCGEVGTPATPPYPSNYIGGLPTVNNQLFAFYAPDYYYTGNQFTFQSGDTFVLENGISYSATTFVNTAIPAPRDSAFKQFYGYNNNTPPIVLNVNDAQFCTTGGTVAISTGVFHNLLYSSLDTPANQWNCWECHVLDLDITGLPDQAPAYACYGYYLRSRADQYGDFNLLRYTFTGVEQYSADVPLATTVPIDVNNGGDTFTQFSSFKQRVKIEDNASNWGNSGCTFYSQNRVNSQMRVQSGTQDLYLLNTTDVWLCSVEQEAVLYNVGYSVYGNDPVYTLTTFDPNLPTITDYGTRAIWSEEKPAGSIVDYYRTIPPLNFYDFPIVHGRITSHLEVNRQLLFLQPYKISLKYFNSEGAFTTVSGDNVVLGENAVMSRRETDLTSFGSRQKQAIVKGRNEAGKDILYWPCTDYKKIMRFGADGIVCISDRALIKTWCESYFFDEFSYANEDQNVASGIIAGTNSIAGVGMSGVWNQKDKEYILTLRWTTNGQYVLGKSISFNEITNRFVSFYNAFPTIYIPVKDVYLTPDSREYNYFPAQSNRASANTGDVYLHDDDTVVNAFKPTYYDSYITGGYVSVIVNADVINNKLFQNYEVDYAGGGGSLSAYGAFIDISFATKTQASVVGNGYSELALDLLRGQIPRDNNGQGVPLNGIWLKTKLYFDVEEIAKLLRYTVKYLLSNRLTQR